MSRLALAVAILAGGCTSTTHTVGRRPPTTTSTTTSTTVPLVTAATAPTTVARPSVRAEAAPPPPSNPPATAHPAGEGGGAAPTAKASWYARGTTTASAEPFDPDGRTFAHLSLPFGTVVRFCHAGACVEARCNDRGPAAWTGRAFDLSRGAFAVLAPLGAGVIDVTWEVL